MISEKDLIQHEKEVQEKYPDQRCQCEHLGRLAPGWRFAYDPTTELPYVNHEPGKCLCTNNLRKYQRNGKTVILCSNCC